MIRVTGACLLLTLALFPSRVLAQGKRWERQVRAQLDRTLAAIEGSHGQSRVLRMGPLNTEESESLTVEMKAGTAYDIVGACDEDCSSLQLMLSTATGSDVAVDRSGENLPVVRFTPSQTGSYTVRVTMAACRLSPCWYGLALRSWIHEAH